MANPSFNATDLTTDAAHNRIGSRQVRSYDETLPGANGLYTQMHGTGGRGIQVAGILSAAGASASAARDALFTAFRAKEALCDGATIGDYIGTDGDTYEYCRIQSYTHGAVTVSVQDSSYKAYTRVSATIIQLVP
jgi:hypothetical protein